MTIKVKGATKTGVAAGFVGLALESTQLGSPILDPAQSNLPSFLALLGPGNLRVGGQTSEQNVAWVSGPTSPLPGWASSSNYPSQLTPLASLAHVTGWSVDLGVNLLHYSATAATGEVQAAHAALGASLHAVEIGNEPDLYSVIGAPTSEAQYITYRNTAMAAITAGTPGVAFAGPDFYLSNWLPGFTKAYGKGLSEFTQHFYPAESCFGNPVSVSDLLSQASITLEDNTIAQSQSAARANHLPVVLDELNSVSCGSSQPVIREFASALWAVHALLEAAAQGVASVNIQTTPGNCNSYTPLCVPDQGAPGTLVARPIFSGMQLVSSLDGGTILRTAVTSTTALPTGVSDYAVRLPTGKVAVVVINTTANDLTQLNLTLTKTSQLASTTSLKAASLDATSGITLTTSPSTGVPAGLTVPAGSAEVFTVTP
ncbi:MAG TPA: hypothetical protein VF320_02045 [Acidimicrobiales bacterium]